MDTQSATSEAQHPYPLSPWTAASTSTSLSTESNSNGAATSQLSESPPDATAHNVFAGGAAPLASHLDFLPFLFPQQNIYHAQLLHYNKLISPARGGGLQTPPLPPIVSSPHVQAGSRSRSSSRVSLKDSSASKGATTGGNGSRAHHSPDKNNGSVITSKDAPAKMAPKQSTETSRGASQRTNAAAPLSHGPSHSSSVPTTPHQHARQFSFESRDPSPNAANGHSPRSAYSETNSALPSLRPLPPRLGGCKFETAQINSRRRIPYSVGNERLEKTDLRNVKNKLSADEERSLSTQMREIYDRLLPTHEVEERRKKLVQKLEKMFNDEWPGHNIRVNLFGSSGNLLCSDDSDVDICITTSWHELEGVCIIADLLARRGMEKVVCISAAKVPIVKMWDPELGLACDMNVNNTLALENTRMVRTYVEADPRVRQLAMIIKYWTRRRIVNDAAFGGTLSSYTWICLIIAFLQLRSPPVLPALHQMPYKIPKSDGTVGDFADNLKKIKGFGGKNKFSVSELLFQFFRFYAHEFDYDKHVLSVRQGKMVTKQDKKWNYAVNNQLCVEEPFNISRNLGNTVDEYSFRGVHLELRRAFDLLSEAKLEAACEQYVFPKEEERVWSRPPPQPRPVLVRSSSQSHSGRGGRGNHRGGRNNNNFHRGGGGGSNRRTSASVPTYDANMFMTPMGLQQDMSWFQSQHYPFQYAQQDLMTQMAYHQESIRQLQLYTQSPAFLQHQALGQQQLQQRVPVASSSANQPSDRSRTRSFDNPPTTAPLRPDLFALYGMNVGPSFYSTNGYGAYPSPPAASTSQAGQDFRRSLQRSTMSTDGGAVPTSSSLRSQSQPAPRSPSGNIAAGYQLESQNSANTSSTDPSRIANGIPVPSFIPDEVESDETPKAVVARAHESLETKPSGLFQAARSLSPTRQQPQQHLPNGIAFGDLATQTSKSQRRRLSTDQLPHTLLDRRIQRASRSPSPLDQSRTFSVEDSTASAPLTSAPFSASQSRKGLASRPLVVNGSMRKTTTVPPLAQRQPSRTERSALDHSQAANLDNALHINTAPTWAGQPAANKTPQPSCQPQATTLHDRPPIVVNGSTAPLTMPYSADDASFRERVAFMNSFYLTNHLHQQESQNGAAARMSPSARQHFMSKQSQNGVIAPLDLAIGGSYAGKPAGVDTVHLSPVYETWTSPPSKMQNHDANTTAAWLPEISCTKPEATRSSSSGAPKETQQRQPDSDKVPKGQRSSTAAQKIGPLLENGHIRGARSESDSGWQKVAGKGKRKVGGNISAQITAHSEAPPKNASDRKGG